MGRSRVWPSTCAVCGETVHLTNFMVRWAITSEGHFTRSNTHETKCKGWTIVSRFDKDYVELFDPLDRVKFATGLIEARERERDDRTAEQRR